MDWSQRTRDHLEAYATGRSTFLPALPDDFLTNMPNYAGLGFELRDPHLQPAPNEYEAVRMSNAGGQERNVWPVPLASKRMLVRSAHPHQAVC